MIHAKEYDNLRLEAGVVLPTTEAGLRRETALKAVAMLRSAGVPVLGGDVWYKYGEHVEVAYANWCTNPRPSDDRQSYLLRTWEDTEAYIKGYRDKPGAESLFVLVVGDPSGSWQIKSSNA